MKEEKRPPEPDDKHRRRFLRESIRGSVPLMLGLAGLPGEASSDAEPDPDSPTGASAPPETTDTAPPQAKKNMDRRQEEFIRDNPGMTRYPSD